MELKNCLRRYSNLVEFCQRIDKNFKSLECYKALAQKNKMYEEYKYFDKIRNELVDQ
ncbi:unnamed protein product [Onchocerca flexuosa]|uniref:Flagellar protein n=1 Tax=Onchocerca flexuosa TaxID=387005 RepID=A0A183HS00_9BILA|nr:unnamed protein product [Onchocerca flexuosa]